MAREERTSKGTAGPMCVAMFSETYKPHISGVVIAVEELVKEVTSLGEVVYLFIPRTPGVEDMPYIKSLPSFNLPMILPYPISLPNFRTIERYTEGVDFDIVHINGLFTNSAFGLELARKRRIPLVMTYHTLITEYSHYLPLPPRIAKSLLAAVARFWMHQVDKVIVSTEKASRDVQKLGAPGYKIAKIPIGIRLERFIQSSATRGNQVNEHNVVYIGRLGKEKNLTFLLTAFATVLDRFQEAKLVIVGDGPERTALKRFAEIQGIGSHIFFTGSVPHERISEILQTATIFAFPSRTETQGLVLVESLASGVPVVAINDGATREVVTDGIEGYLVSSTEEFADRIVELLNNKNLYQHMSKAAEDKAKEFSVDKYAQRVVSLYRELRSTKSEV